MPKLSNIRYQKQDDYQNSIFICNSEKETKNYQKLKRYYNQLQETDSDSFLPIFENSKHKYATIRVKKNTMISQLKLQANDVVNIKFNIYKKAHNGKVYVNCLVDSIKLVNRAPPITLGDEMKFDDSDSDSDSTKC